MYICPVCLKSNDVGDQCCDGTFLVSSVTTISVVNADYDFENEEFTPAKSECIEHPERKLVVWMKHDFEAVQVVGVLSL